MTRTKKTSLSAAAVLASASMLLAACGGSTGTSGGDASSAAAGDCASKEVFCVGLVTDLGKVDDKSFNQSAHDGVTAAAKEIKGLQSKVVETTDTKDYANNIKQFTDKKYDVVITVGFLMAEATTTAAAEYPDTHFIGVDQVGNNSKNLTGLTFPEDKAGYAAGFLAGSLSKSNKIGQVLGMDVPAVKKYALGYEAGAKKANPQISVATVYHPAGDNAFTDPAWGAAEAQKQLDQGADVIFGAGGKTGNGALGATAKAPNAGTSTYCIGVDTDQWNTVPEAKKCLVTSATKNISEGVNDILLEINDGTADGGDFVGTAGLAPYHDFESKIPADVKTKVADVVKGLEDGSIKTGVKVS